MVTLPTTGLMPARRAPMTETSMMWASARGMAGMGALPLVSCIMPTADRSVYAAQAVRYFDRQTYPRRELIIVDDGGEPMRDVPERPDIRVIRLTERQSIGAKRNLACAHAYGDIIAQWDDDDWYAPGRLSLQVEPLLQGDADITGLPAMVFFDLDRWEFWQPEPWLHEQLFVGNVAGGTLVYRRDVWDRLARYPDTSLAEDADLLRAAVRQGARLRRIERSRTFIYVRHGKNSWRFRCGEHVDASAWRPIREPVVPACDAAFYRQRSLAHRVSDDQVATRQLAKAPVTSSGKHPRRRHRTWPLVSCLMPTADRRELVSQSIAYFERLDYPERELVIVDDGDDAVADLVPDHGRIRYLRLDAPSSLGEKRNLACEAAAGDLLAHWDDDDWYAPWRLCYQVRELKAAQADVAGLAALRFYDPYQSGAWLYRHPEGLDNWVAGATLCYTRSFWEAGAFPPVGCGEDDLFVSRARPEKVIAHAISDFAVALIHPKNTCPKRVESQRYQPEAEAGVRALLGEDFGFYRQLAGHSPRDSHGRR